MRRVSNCLSLVICSGLCPKTIPICSRAIGAQPLVSPERLIEENKERYYEVLEQSSARGEKTEAVLAAVDRQVSTFRVADLRAECPGVGVDLIRRILARLQKEGKINSLGAGRSAKWEKTVN